tara:strand:- start:326 stop:955 length:630 start_codon:yes stop_codon:yes gene_type:complete
MSIKQNGGVFGRNPTFNDVTIEGQLTFDGDIDINSDLKINGALEVDGGDVTISAGNLVIGTSGKGIDFSATAGTGTSELLDDYEEGTWTPAFGAGTNPTVAFAQAEGVYTKVGNLVTVSCSMVTTSRSGGSGQLTVDGLPFSCNTSVGASIAVGFNYNWNTPPNGGTLQDTQTHVLLYSAIESNTASVPTDIVASGSSYFKLTVTYQTA